RHHRLGALFGALLLASAASGAMAQAPEPAPSPNGDEPPSLQPRPDPGTDVAPPGQPVSADEIAFEAARIDYDYERDIVTASGDVRGARDGATLAAEEVVWDRKAGTVVARGDVMLTSRD